MKLLKSHLFQYLSLLPLFLIVIISFFYYSPYHYPEYNSDHSIQSLMSMSFNFKRDFFYWGQNRLGSFLPMITYPLYKVTHLPPLYLISVVHYSLLLISCLLVTRFVSNYWLKMAVYCVVFLPVSDYRAIFLIGHPYSVQLFCGSLFFYCLIKLYHKLKNGFYKDFDFATREKVLLVLLSLLAGFSFCIGFWTSELNVILCFTLIIFVFLDRGFMFRSLRSKTVLLVFIIFITTVVSLLLFFYYFKNTFPKDEVYDHPFFFDHDRILQQFNFLKKRVINLLYFKDNLLYDNLFYYLLFVLFLVFLTVKRNSIKNILFNKFFISALLTVLISYILLFYSTWNLRSEFCPRYYTPIYYLFILSFIAAINNKFTSVKASFFGVILVVFSVFYTYDHLHDKPTENAPKRFSEFKELPEGTLIAGYWDTYVISSIAYENLIPLPFENQFVRNGFMIPEAFRTTNYYFIRNDEFINSGFRDTILQFGHRLAFTGKKYNCNGLEVLHYVKVK